MANTKAIIPTKVAFYGVAVLGAVLAGFAGVNLFSTFTPITHLNAQINARLKPAASLPADQRLVQFNELKQKQEAALAAKPSEPYAWARLSYLRDMTGADAKDAFAALRMADFVSPNEPEQLPERAAAWRNFRSVETKNEQDYQDALWQKAFTIDADATWDTALKLGVVKDVGAAIMRKDRKLGEGWHDRMSEAGLD